MLLVPQALKECHCESWRFAFLTAGSAESADITAHRVTTRFVTLHIVIICGHAHNREMFYEAVALVALMVATPLLQHFSQISPRVCTLVLFIYLGRVIDIGVEVFPLPLPCR